MKKQQAIDYIRKVFERPFDKNTYAQFVHELLNDIHTVDKTFSANKQYIKDAYKSGVKRYERIGTYTSPDHHKIDVMVVWLERESSLEKARTLQRNFIADYLKTRDEKEAALVAFVSPNEEEWRFSLVKMEYELEQSASGSVKVKEQLTPARRFSFLVGAHEDSHTAQKQLLPLLESETNPALLDLEQAFSIEKVTKEFFNQYKELFLELVDQLNSILNKSENIKQDFEIKGIKTADFAKKLMGQIVFLYFIQKKGWLGVNKDSAWGEGPKDFIRKLFEGSYGPYSNFFNEVLEPLFYEALATERTHHWSDRFHCKIPFLNGGLFEPLNEYDWVHTDIEISNDIFSNSERTKDGDVGSGILDVFDRYNFTVKENEPLEKEVAVDPEMLGKVFENLLEIKDRKSKGAYYTPREIVHYMCQESLINYLRSKLETEVSDEDLRELIDRGDQAIDFFIAKKNGNKTYKQYLPESIVDNAKLLDDALASITICDPAIGSGAFPVGMMTEIIRLRHILTKLLGKEVSEYDLKRHTIQQSLYGVDVDIGAVEIAKLRLWLSLVVDEDDINNIKPLPNLDYKIMQGNSLVEEYEGIKLFDEELFVDFGQTRGQIEELKIEQSQLQRDFVEKYNNNELSEQKKSIITGRLKSIEKSLKKLQKLPDINTNAGLFDDKKQSLELKRHLENLHKEFFKTPLYSEKKRIKQEIEKLEWKLIETTLNEQAKQDSLSKLKELKDQNYRPFFLWKLNFPEVFDKGGFDVVIGNPPYGASYPKEQKKYFRKNYLSAQSLNELKGSLDTFSLFIELALNLSKRSSSAFSYIVPMAFVSSDSMSSLHSLLFQRAETLFTSTYSNRPAKIFQNADQRVAIIIAKISEKTPVQVYSSSVNKRYTDESIQDVIDNIEYINSTEFIKYGRIPKIGKNIEKQILSKIFKQKTTIRDLIENNGKPVYYRTSGGRYYNIITPYPTGSSKEKPVCIQAKYQKLVGALLTSNMYYWLLHIYSNQLDLKKYELEMLPVPVSRIDDETLIEVNNIYDTYLKDLERNATVKKADYSNVDEFKEYTARRSKHLIDKIDRKLGPVYGLNKEEIEFLINYDIKFRTDY